MKVKDRVESRNCPVRSPEIRLLLVSAHHRPEPVGTMSLQQLCYGEFSVWHDFRLTEAQHNMIFGNASLHEVMSDSMFRAVALNPDFAIDNVNVNNRGRRMGGLR